MRLTWATAVSVLPSRYIRMYTVYHVHIHMSEGLWFFNKKKYKKNGRDEVDIDETNGG